MIVDTHIHVWDLTKAKYEWLDGNTTLLNRTYYLQEIEEERKQAGITSGVLVQAACNTEDTDIMLDVARKNKWIRGVVVWLPLLNTGATKKLLEEKYLREPFFKGVRHLIHDEKDPQWLLQPSVIDSLKLLAEHDIPYDVVGVLPQHIETVLKVAEKIPSLRMVFDHLNHPPAAPGEKYNRWASLMTEASSHKNLFAKISGLGTTTGKESWNEDDISKAVSFVIDRFGADRCFCGGDWPVSLLAGSYSSTWTKYKNLLEKLTSKQDRENILSSNANRFYSLKEEVE